MDFQGFNRHVLMQDEVILECCISWVGSRTYGKPVAGKEHVVRYFPHLAGSYDDVGMTFRRHQNPYLSGQPGAETRFLDD